MSRLKPAARTYVRPMGGWWRKNPFFVRYMLREASALFLSAYALVLLTGLYRLTQGEAPFEAWRASLATPLSIAFHALALLFVAYHALTWFQVMPKTAPRLPFDARLLTAGGLVLAAALSAGLLAALWWVAR